MNTLLEDARLLEAGAAAEVRVLPPFFDRPGAELLLAHRAREVRKIKDVAHDLHGQVALRRLLAVAGAPNVVVEAVLRARPRRVRGGCGRGGHFLGVGGSWSLKHFGGALRRCSETLEQVRFLEFELELCAVRSG